MHGQKVTVGPFPGSLEAAMQGPPGNGCHVTAGGRAPGVLKYLAPPQARTRRHPDLTCQTLTVQQP